MVENLEKIYFGGTEADYVLDNYGRCEMGGGCVCIRPGAVWLGRGCSRWVPLGARSLEALRIRLTS